MHAKSLYKVKIAMSRTFSNFSRILQNYTPTNIKRELIAPSVISQYVSICFLAKIIINIFLYLFQFQRLDKVARRFQGNNLLNRFLGHISGQENYRGRRDDGSSDSRPGRYES